MTLKSITDASFREEVLGASGPVLVDFWAEWCVQYRAIAPSLEEIGEELSDKVTLVKLNDNPEVPTGYGVRGIPTMILFRNGEEAARKNGAAPKSALQGWFEGALADDRSEAASG